MADIEIDAEQQLEFDAMIRIAIKQEEHTAKMNRIRAKFGAKPINNRDTWRPEPRTFTLKEEAMLHGRI